MIQIKNPFPKLSVKTRPELVTLDPDVEFDANNSTKGLSVDDWHQYLEDNPETVVLDARNSYESQIGNFKAKNLITPQIKTFKEIKPVVKKLPKDEPVLTYCTGNIRCQYLSAYMKKLGFKKVHHLRGGIMAYGKDIKIKVFGRESAIHLTVEAKLASQTNQSILPTVWVVKTRLANKPIAEPVIVKLLFVKTVLILINVAGNCYGFK